MTIAYQLYCSRNFPPLDATLGMLAATGYTAVEGFGGLYGDPGALRADLDRHGLTMPSGHFGLDQLEDQTAAMLNVAKTVGMTNVYCPWVHPDLRPSDAKGWAAFGQRLARAGQPFKDAGYKYAWHNHDFELVDLGGTTPLDLIAEAGVDLELDLGWVKRAGQDPAAWIAKYAGRIHSLHIKDIAPAGQAADEDGWADVGHGIQDWAAVNAARKAAGITHLVVEHDNPKDHARFAARSLATVKGW
jgi:sugar phosphate isomerase/epimerase